MNTILTDDERPKLPEPRVPKDSNTSTWDKFSAAQMEAYADAREAAVLAKLREQEPVAWLVCSINKDGSPSLEHAAAWKEAAHEHINDAITEHEIEDAASWVVRPAYAEPLPAVVQEPQKYDDVLVPFLSLMRRELHANSGKGDRPGWLSMDANTALLEVYYHLAKLQKAVRNNDGPGIQEYAADVANMAMMVLDVCGGIEADPEAPAQGDLSVEASAEGFESVADYVAYLKNAKDTYFAERNSARDAARRNREAQPSVPAPWREAVKVMREALVDVKHGLEGARIWGGMDWSYNPLHPFKYLPLRDKAAAALAQLDALEGGE